MFLKDFFAKREPRKFGFIPYYYQKEDEETDGPGPRIRFRRIRQARQISNKSVRSLVLLVVFLLFCLFLLRLVTREMRTFDIESIRIEDVPGDHRL